MPEEHPNVALLKRFTPPDVAGAADLFSDDVIFHYFNPHLPDLEGDYVGRDELQAFFDKLARQTSGAFEVTPVSVIPIGEELVVAQTVNKMTMGDQRIAVDVVVVWRFIDGRIVEVWDIPAVHSARISHTNG